MRYFPDSTDFASLLSSLAQGCTSEPFFSRTKALILFPFSQKEPSMRRFSTSIVLVLSTLLIVAFSSAQQAATTAVPNLVRYSGTLKDAQGAAAVPSTTIGVTFTIYQQQEGGAPVWQEMQNVTTDANGQYSILLGSLTAGGLPDDLFSQQEQRWLGVQVQGQAEEPRVLLVSVPYALKAHEAETLGGLPPSAFVKAPPTDSSGGTSADSSTAVNAVGTANAGGPSMGGKAGPGKKSPLQTAGTIPVYNGVGDSDSLMSQALVGATVVNDNGSFNLLNPNTMAYQIGANNVLSIPGTQNLFLGAGAGSFNAGTQNTFVGANAATSNVTGNYNTVIGEEAGYYKNLGDHNAFVGFRAGYRNHQGSFNAFLGDEAGHYNNGNNNAFFGRAAGFGPLNYAGNQGSANTFIGEEAGRNNSADNNAFIGYQAGYSNGSGTENAFVGFQAGYANDNGSSNAYFGFQAGYNSVASLVNPNPIRGNTFIGHQAGYNNGSSDNTFVGAGAGVSNRDGDWNTFSGSGAGASNSRGQENTFTGYSAGAGSLGDDNTIVGAFAGYGFGTGIQNTILGAQAGENGFGEDNILIGYRAGYQGNGGEDIYVGNRGFGESNTIRIGNDSGGYAKQTATYIAGIFTSDASVVKKATDLVVCVNPSGGLYGAVAGTTCTLSSRRFKENILDMGDNSSKLFQLRPVTFFYKPQYDDGSHLLQYGLIAEEVAKVYPDMVAYDKEGQPYTVKYQLLAPMLLNELQKQHTVVAAQQDVIKSQQEQIQTQGQQIADLQGRLSRLESLILKR
jgi:trimeric autotransporter adhesin